MERITKEDGAAAYAEATDSTRHLVRVTRDNARQWQRVKPDPETHPLAELDYEKEPTRGKDRARTSVVHAADLANPVRVGADVLTMLLAHELD